MYGCFLYQPGAYSVYLCNTSALRISLVGYGIHIFDGTPDGSLPNNALVTLDSTSTPNTLRLFCRSDSMMEDVGVLIGLGGTAIGDTSFFDIENPQAGELTVTSAATSIPNNDQGVYTCRIPDSTSTMRDVNIGIYNTNNNGKLY